VHGAGECTPDGPSLLVAGARLYFPGFASTRDFGPFLGFTKARPATSTLILHDIGNTLN
jgi:hypothetical protein